MIEDRYAYGRKVWAIADVTAWAAAPTANVLVIDDDHGLSRIVAMVLRRSGFLVDVANSGDAGIALAGANHYDAIVLDLRMPGKDGRTVFRELRQAGNQTPVMILSAYDAREARDELGAQGYLNKPFEPDRLVTELQSLLVSRS